MLGRMLSSGFFGVSLGNKVRQLAGQQIDTAKGVGWHFVDSAGPVDHVASTAFENGIECDACDVPVPGTIEQIFKRLNNVIADFARDQFMRHFAYRCVAGTSLPNAWHAL